ncbi:hypothetical protein [Clostridium sp. BNL1100]|uniref:alpha-pore-forming tripartite toxin MakABE regulator n=1 Tax=Clostridium sp. BNL1100 TaxID=755731 RepID=UPI00024A7AE4|nr:hypothetical protein [Clostridium sp. BNL1100]AEY67468.1 hypothetical protein Clo1100_3323 [Clostridium sp. BNL1100]
MKKIEILIIVDANGALSTNSLQSNVYMVDTNKWLGSWNESTCNLHTVCEDQQLICWRVVAISESSLVSIENFSGQLTNQNICTPQKSGSDECTYWEGRVETKGASGRFAYSVNLNVDGKNFSLASYVDVQ